MSSTAGETIRVASKAPSRARRHLCARGDADIRLGIVLLSAGGSGRSRSPPTPAGRCAWVVGGLSLGLLTAGVDFSVGRPRHCAAWRSSCAGRERRASGGGPIRSGAGALSAGFSGGLAGDRTRHGRGSLRSRLCDSRPPLWPWRTLGDHDADAVRRFCEHGLLASFRLPRCTSGVARRMPGLCRLPDRRCAAGLSVRAAARISAARASAGVAEFASDRTGIARRPRKHFSPAGRRRSRWVQ